MVDSYPEKKYKNFILKTLTQIRFYKRPMYANACKCRCNHKSETRRGATNLTERKQAQKGNSRVRLEMTNKRAKIC